MDKRRSPRYAISLNALVHPRVGRSWLCSIRDFCDGGMLLVEQEASRRRSLPGISQGEMVGIHFSVPSSGKDQHFRLEGKIVRVMESGVGITFPGGIDDDAMARLLGYSNSQPLASNPADANKTEPEHPSAKVQGSSLELDKPPGAEGGIAADDAYKIIGDLRKEVARVLPEMTSAFFTYMDEQLLALARDARTNAEQSEYFAAMSNLEKAKKAVGQSFASEVLDQIDNPRNLKKLLEDRKAAEAERKEKQASRVKLSLVNTDEFEDWLAVANIISRSERVFEKHLNEIQPRLGMLVDSWGHNEANPLGTAVFCHAFDNAIRKVDLTKEVRQKVYSGFEAKAVPLFRKLYIQVEKLLEQSGLFPDIDEDFIVPSAIVTRDEPAEETAVTDADDSNLVPEEPYDAAPESEQDVDLRKEISDLRAQVQRRSADRGRGRDNGGRPPSPASGQAAPGRDASPPPGTTVQDAPGNDGEAAPRSRRGDIGEAISNIYSTVRNLMGRSDLEAGADFDGEEGELVQLDEVQELLSALQQEVSGSSERLPVRRRLQESATAGGRARRIPPQALESLGVVESLVDTIENDNMLSGSAKGWIRQLELTLDKVATTNDNFLNAENPHGSLEVINELAKLGGTESGSVKRSVDEIVSRINQDYDSNPAIFDEALSRLKPLVERQSRTFTGNVQRTVKASQGQQTLVNAQRAVVEEMNIMLSGQQVPEVLLKLLVPGWRNLMVNTHLRQGEDSPDWKKHVQALEQVFKQLQRVENLEQSPGYIPPDQLIKYIEQGLDSIAFEPGQRTPLLNSLKQFIIDGADTSKIPMVEVPELAVASTLGFADVGARDQKREQLLSEHGADPEWQRWLERAGELFVGEWLEITDGKIDDKIAIVAWSDEDHANYVLVNRRGVKTHEMMVEDIATRLHEGTAKIMEEADIPLTDRASHQMLQNMHNQLTHQATHDELTGLINRKEFERQLQRVLGLTKRNDTHHLVAYMDLDQFKVVNNAAGHEAGDKLLIQVARLLEDKLSEGAVVLSRLGGDEFGLLIENCEKESGISVIKQLADAVRALRFEWEGHAYSLTVSCGIVYVDKDIESVTSILRGADSACFTAKDGGRDRIHVYEADDTVMEHRRDIMEFVSQIDRAIREDRFILNCQKIVPIEASSKNDIHYEILLTVLDQNDNPMPPQDFIVAAETYNRMGAIDRWVIKNAFKFLAGNILKLDYLGPFSINISGNSLNEEDFMEFVLEQFNETRLPTSKICFEITETAAISRLDAAVDFMEKLKVIGVKFSLDDFGTGLSSYSYLRNLPIDYLKIDGIFVKDIKNNPNDYAVVKSINEIGHFMGKKTIAEFVEDEEILEILREIGVDFAQGYAVEHKRPITDLVP